MIATTVYFVALLVVSYIVFNRDLMHPAVILLICGTVCAVVCLINYKRWQLSALQPQTVLLILLGTVCLILPLFTVTYKSYIHEDEYCDAQDERLFNRSIVVNKKFTYSVIISELVIYYLYYSQVMHIGEIGRSIYPVKTYSTLWYVKNINTGISVSPILSNGVDLSFIFGYIYMYIWISNIIYERKVSARTLSYMFPTLIWAFQSVLFGGRTGLLQLAVAGLVMLYTIWRSCKSKSKHKLSNSKFLIKAAVFTTAVLVIFFALNTVSGRVKTGMTPGYYLSLYLGSGFKNFDSYIRYRNSTNTNLFGGETFGGLYTFLKRYGVARNYAGVTLPYETPINGFFMGNTYTSLRRYYNDFGIIGVIIIPLIIGTVIGIIYNHINLYSLKKNNWLSVYYLIVYSIIVYSLVLFYIEDYFCLNILSINYLLRLLGIYIAVRILFKHDLVSLRDDISSNIVL